MYRFFVDSQTAHRMEKKAQDECAAAATAKDSKKEA